MKKIITVFSLLFFIGATNAQQASDYFPSQTGFEWKFKAIPLDSVSNPINSLAYFRIDSFASVANYEGKLANIVPTKIGSLQTIQLLPFIDSLFYATEGTNGFEYFSTENIEPFLIALDASGFVSNFSFLSFFRSLQDWYDIYRFTAGTNEYTLLQKDTLITINSTGYNFRFKYVGKKLQDETIQTVLGSINCKKFLIQWKIAYVLGPLVFDLLSTKDSIWIAEGNWIVQDIIPGQYIDNLTILGVPPFSIPGLETKLTDEIVVSVANEETIPSNFSLEQNYPNPFNPSTSIQYAISSRQFVSLKVYDILGNEIATLVNEEKPAGNYEVEFGRNLINQVLTSGVSDKGGYTSGVYFYQLRAGSFVDTKKMVLLK
jgi:hypothetical protein